MRLLNKDPTITVTAVTRESSKATIPEGLKLARVGDQYPPDQVEAAFKGQDAVILVPARFADEHLSSLAKASVRAGVRRLIASGFGGNDENAAARRVFPTSAQKYAMVQELRSMEQPEWSWTSICTGLFIDLYVVSTILLCFSVCFRLTYRDIDIGLQLGQNGFLWTQSQGAYCNHLG